MQVKLHLNRLIGSFRRKDHKNIVTQQIQSRDAQTTSRWELLDTKTVDLEEIQHEEHPSVITMMKEFSSKKSMKSSRKPLSGLSPSNSNNEDEEATAKGGLSYFGSKWGSKRRKKDKTDNSHSAIMTQDSSNYSAQEDLSSVVDEINNTIGMMGEFVPTELQSWHFDENKEATSSNFSPQQRTIEVTIHTTDLEAPFALNTPSSANMILPSSSFQCQNFPDDSEILWGNSSAEGTGLTTLPSQCRLICSSNSPKERREVINLFESGSHGPFATTAAPGPHPTSTFTQDSPTGNPGVEEICKIFLATSRHDDDDHDFPGTDTYGSTLQQSNRPGALDDQGGRLAIVRRSGRRLYNKIHKTFSKKDESTANNNKENVPTATTSMSRGGAASSTFIEKIPRMSRLNSSRLTQSFRKVIRLKGKSSFQELDERHTGSIGQLQQFTKQPEVVGADVGNKSNVDFNDINRKNLHDEELARKVLFESSFKNDNPNYEIYQAIQTKEWITF